MSSTYRIHPNNEIAYGQMDPIYFMRKYDKKKNIVISAKSADMEIAPNAHTIRTTRKTYRILNTRIHLSTTQKATVSLYSWQAQLILFIYLTVCNSDFTTQAFIHRHRSSEHRTHSKSHTLQNSMSKRAKKRSKMKEKKKMKKKEMMNNVLYENLLHNIEILCNKRLIFSLFHFGHRFTALLFRLRFVHSDNITFFLIVNPKYYVCTTTATTT